MKCPSIERKIPRSRMQEGIDLCKKNILDYLQDARAIAKEKRLHHATISAEFAIEELGKILLLKQSLENNSDPVEIDGEKFCSHRYKANEAWDKILDPQYRLLFEERWDDEMWNTGRWNGKREIDDTTRLECSFVDFIDNHWVIGKRINEELFQDFIFHFEEKLSIF